MVTHLEECGAYIKRIWILSKNEGDRSREWNITRLVESRDHRPLLREIAGIVLFLGLRSMKEHVITHRETSSLSSLKEWGTLDIS